MTASVSVVIPCYNYGHFLGAAVGSALDDQPGMEVRVLVIDDASTDGSAEVARAIAARDPRVQVLAHATNRGHIATYNEGLLDWADGDYSVLLSADDRLAPGALRRATALLDAHPEAGFAYGHPVRFREGTPPRAAKTTVRGWSVWPGRWWLERRCRTCISCISSPEVVVRIEYGRMELEDRGGRRKPFPIGPGYLIDGRPVILTAPRRAAPTAPARTASGSVAMQATARVALASRIYVEGRHDAEHRDSHAGVSDRRQARPSQKMKLGTVQFAEIISRK